MPGLVKESNLGEGVGNGFFRKIWNFKTFVNPLSQIAQVSSRERDIKMQEESEGEEEIEDTDEDEDSLKRRGEMVARQDAEEIISMAKESESADQQMNQNEAKERVAQLQKEQNITIPKEENFEVYPIPKLFIHVTRCFRNKRVSKAEETKIFYPVNYYDIVIGQLIFTDLDFLNMYMKQDGIPLENINVCNKLNKYLQK
jgi:GTPase involved in cell partitioning and DNA repair